MASSNKVCVNIEQAFTDQQKARARGNIDAFAIESAAPKYRSTIPYPKAGTLCHHEGKLYRSTVPIEEPEEWDSRHWCETNFADELDVRLIEMTPEEVEALVGSLS